MRADGGKHLLPSPLQQLGLTKERAGWANAQTRPQSASASQTARYKWKKIGAHVVSTSFDLWGRSSDVASILSSGSQRQMTTALGRHENLVLRWWRKGSEQLSLYLPANSVGHFMPTVLWNSKGSTRRREIKPAGQDRRLQTWRRVTAVAACCSKRLSRLLGQSQGSGFISDSLCAPSWTPDPTGACGAVPQTLLMCRLWAPSACLSLSGHSGRCCPDNGTVRGFPHQRGSGVLCQKCLPPGQLPLQKRSALM